MDEVGCSSWSSDDMLTDKSASPYSPIMLARKSAFRSDFDSLDISWPQNTLTTITRPTLNCNYNPHQACDSYFIRSRTGHHRRFSSGESSFKASDSGKDSNNDDSSVPSSEINCVDKSNKKHYRKNRHKLMDKNGKKNDQQTSTHFGK